MLKDLELRDDEEEFINELKKMDELDKLKMEDFVVSKITKKDYEREIKDCEEVTRNTFEAYNDFMYLTIYDLMDLKAYTKKDDTGTNWYYIKDGDEFYSLGY